MGRKWTEEEILRYQREEAARPRLQIPAPEAPAPRATATAPAGGCVIVLSYSEPEGDDLSGFIIF